MKVTCYNEEQLDKIIKQIYEDFEKHKELNIFWEKKKKDKSIAQLGFFWGALIGSIQDYFLECGIEYDPEDIKNNFYNAVSYMDERFRRKVRRFSGEEYEVQLRISEKDIETISRLIDRCIWLIDNSEPFRGIKLSTDIRNSWIRHITPDDMRMVDISKLPYEDKEYMEYLRKQTCLVCGCHNNIEAHHLRIKNTGGVAKKPPSYMCISLCRDCHRKYHLKGHNWFLEKIKWLTKYVDIDRFVIFQYYRWKNKL